MDHVGTSTAARRTEATSTVRLRVLRKETPALFPAIHGHRSGRARAKGTVPADRLERLVMSLVDGFGAPDLKARELEERLVDSDERTAWAEEMERQLGKRDQLLATLQSEVDERGAWALERAGQLAEREGELAAIRSSRLWRAARLLYFTPRRRMPGGR